jgi:4-amino-4-deoxy-L-arabinose transferase-like glycosyltransferase
VRQNPSERPIDLRSQLWGARGLWAGLVAFALAWVGERKVIGVHDFVAAQWWYAAAIALTILGLARRVRGQTATAAPAEATARPGLWSRWQEWRGRLGWRLTLPGLTLVCVLTAAMTFILQANIASHAGAWLWVAALVALTLTFLGAPGWPRADGLLPGPYDDAFAEGAPRLSVRWEVVLAVGLLLLALYLRLTNLEYMPGINGDEGEQGVNARAIVEGAPAVLFGYGWWGVPNLYFHCAAWMLRIFGDSMVGLRMLSVISGVLAVWFAYRVGRLLWGPRCGLIAGLLLAVSPLALQFSRTGSVSTPTGTLWGGGFLFLLRALRWRSWGDWVISAIFFGLGLYFYPAGKIIIPLLPVIGLYALVRWRSAGVQRYALGFLLMLFTFSLVFLPYGIFSAKDQWRGFGGRAQETSILSPQSQQQTFSKLGLFYDPAWAQQSIPRAALGHPLAWARVMFEQFRISVEIIYRRADPTGFYAIREHDGSMMAPFLAALTVLGLAYAGWKMWDPRYGLINLWFWGGLLAVALTTDTPSAQRLTCAWPAVTLFPAVLLDRVCAAAWPLSRTFARRWVNVPLCALLIFFAADGYREYFIHSWSLCTYCNATAQARHVQAVGPTYKFYQFGVGEADIWFGYGSTKFAAKGVEGVDVPVPADIFPITSNRDKGLAFIVWGYNERYLPLIRLYYPGGTEEVVKLINDVPRFTSYRLTPAQTAAFQTLRATYTTTSGRTFNRDEPNLGTQPGARAASQSWAPPPEVTYPAQATWQGGLVAPAYGLYRFVLLGGTDIRFEVDGRVVLDTPSSFLQQMPATREVTMVLAKGVHDVRLKGTLGDPNDTLALQWEHAGSPLAPVDRNYLYAGPTGGLAGEVWSAQADTSLEVLEHTPPRMRRSDPFFGFRVATVALDEVPFVARWTGSLIAPTEGNYTFETLSNGPSTLLVDGQTVLSNSTNSMTQSVAGATDLTAGRHAVDLRYAWKEGRAQVEWYWTPPGGARALVPPTALQPGARSWIRGEIPEPPQKPH